MRFCDQQRRLLPVAIATDLHIVTGKGGTGKTTMAASLAVALASQNRKVLLCEVEGRQGLAQLFDVSPLPYEERRVATGLGGGGIYALAIDPEQALLEYLDLYYRMGRAGKALDRFGVIDFATTIAPGLRDVLLTGKVYEAARRKRHNAFVYDAVVMDAPPTGRISRFLNVNTEVAGLAKVGPIRRQADSIMEMLRSPSTRVHVVTLLEEMPVQETIDAISEIREDRLHLGHIMVNMVRPSSLSRTTIDALDTLEHPDGLETVLKANGLDPAAASSLWQQGRTYASRLTLQQQQRAVIDEIGPPVTEFPRSSGGIDVGSLYEVAESLIEQGAL